MRTWNREGNGGNRYRIYKGNPSQTINLSNRLPVFNAFFGAQETDRRDSINKVLDIPAARLYRKMNCRVCLRHRQAPRAIPVDLHNRPSIEHDNRPVSDKVLDIPAKQLYRRIEEKVCHENQLTVRPTVSWPDDENRT
jgi:hypothetical protein